MRHVGGGSLPLFGVLEIYAPCRRMQLAAVSQPAGALKYAAADPEATRITRPLPTGWHRHEGCTRSCWTECCAERAAGEEALPELQQTRPRSWLLR